MMKIFLTLFTLLFVTTAPQLAAAQTDDAWEKLDVARRYNLFWGGVTAGVMAAEIREEKPGFYRFEVHIRAAGLLEFFTKYHSETVTYFRIDDKGNILPVKFFSTGVLRGSRRTTTIIYNKDGNVVTSSTNPPTPSWKREIIPVSQLVGTPDPLSAAVICREMMKQYLDAANSKNHKTFHIPIYDGRRLGDYAFTFTRDVEVSYKRKMVPALEMRFSRSPIAGFSDNELKTLKDEPQIRVYIPKNTSLLPIKAEAKVLYSTAVVMFDRECPSIEQCLQ